MVQMLSESEVRKYDSVDKWTELKVGEKTIQVYLERPLFGDFEHPEDFIMDAKIYKMFKWSRNYLFLKYK